MEKKCFKCGSTDIVKVVPASAASIPEIKKDIEEGRAVMSCCCAGTGRSSVFRCKACGFEWDYYYELGVSHQEENNAPSEDEPKLKDKKKWWKRSNC